MNIVVAKALVLGIAAAILPAAEAADTEEVLAVVVAPGSGHRVDGREGLAAIYRRKKQFWNDGQRIEPVNLPADDPLRQRFSQRVLGLMPEQLDAYWNEMYFHGVLPPHVMASVEAVLRFVATTPAAIGYVPLCSVDMRVSLDIAIDSQGRIIDKPLLDGCTR